MTPSWLHDLADRIGTYRDEHGRSPERRAVLTQVQQMVASTALVEEATVYAEKGM